MTHYVDKATVIQHRAPTGGQEEVSSSSMRHHLHRLLFFRKQQQSYEGQLAVSHDDHSTPKSGSSSCDTSDPKFAGLQLSKYRLASDGDSEVKPPHLIVQDQTSTLSQKIRFYVSIYCIMASNLPWVTTEESTTTTQPSEGTSIITPSGHVGSSANSTQSAGAAGGRDHRFLNQIRTLIGTKGTLNSSGGTSATSETGGNNKDAVLRKPLSGTGNSNSVHKPKSFLTLSWDGQSYSRRVSSEEGEGPHVRWRETIRFFWDTDSLTDLHKSSLDIAVWQSTYRHPVLLGFTSVSISTIANGPIHHDLPILRHVSLEETEHAGKGRLQFDIRMSQICNLFITPIEIIAHINETEESFTNRQTLRPIITATPPTVNTCIDSSRIPNTEVDVVARAAEPTAVDAEVLELETSATGGHAAEDARENIVAKWRITVIPTGVYNPTEFASSWTELSSQPYWNSLQATSSPLLLGGSGSDKHLSPRSSGLSPNSSGLSPSPVDLTHREMGGRFGDKMLLSAISQRDNSYIHPQHRGLLEHQASFGVSHLLSMPSSSVMAGQSQPNMQAVRQTTESEEQEIQNSYQALARACRGGRLAKALVKPVLPTCQLRTTSDILRQHHLNLRLYAKPLGIGSQKLFGETWVPFFKLYDSDVVESSNQHFFDSYFCEKLWQDGRCVGRLEGLIVFQDNPLVRQMLAGVHTERGFNRIAPPILGSEHKSVRFKFEKEALVPREITNLAQLHVQLLDQLYVKTQKSITQIGGVTEGGDVMKYTQELQRVCDEILTLLSSNHLAAPEGQIAKCSYLYHDIGALLTGQKVLLNLATHCLDYIDYVPWHFRGTYGAILMVILKRGEMDVGNILPAIPKCARGLPTADLKHVILISKRRLGFQQQSTSMPMHSQKPSTPTTQPTPNAVSTRQQRDRPSTKRATASVTTAVPTATRQFSTPLTEPKSPASSPSSNDVKCDDPTLACRSDDMTEADAAKWVAFTSNLSGSELLELVSYHKRMKACRMYYLILRRLLAYCLEKVSSEALFEGQRRYVCSFLAMLYFRLPLFRRELLNSVLEESEKNIEIPEWRGTEFNLDSSSLEKLNEWQSNKIPGVFDLQVALDWEAFHDALENYFGADSLRSLVDSLSLPNVDGWVTSFLRPRALNFLSFLENWCKNTYSSLLSQRRAVVSAYDTIATGHIVRPRPMVAPVVDRPRPFDPAHLIQSGSFRWDLVPGFGTLVKALLITMKSEPVEKYPDALLNCTGALLVNERLLSVFVKIVFLKTSVYSRDQVFAVLNYLDFWVQVLSLRHRPFPPAFDHRFLAKGLSIVIESDLALQTAKGLWFLYKRLDFFHGFKLKNVLFDVLLNRNFNRLFLNWSWLVRRCFIWILLYRLCEATRLVIEKIGFDDGRPYIVGHESNTSTKADQIDRARQYHDVLTVDEKLMCWCYVLFCRHLAMMGMPHVFPRVILYRQMPVLLGTTTETRSRVQNAEGEFNLGACLALPLILPPVNVSADRQPMTFKVSRFEREEPKLSDHTLTSYEIWGKIIRTGYQQPSTTILPSGRDDLESRVAAFMNPPTKQQLSSHQPTVAVANHHSPQLDFINDKKSDRRLISRLISQRSPKSSAAVGGSNSQMRSTPMAPPSAGGPTRSSPMMGYRKSSALESEDDLTLKAESCASPPLKPRFTCKWRNDSVDELEFSGRLPSLALPAPELDQSNFDPAGLVGDSSSSHHHHHHHVPQPCVEYVCPCEFLPPADQPDPVFRAYYAHALEDIAREIAQYQNWVFTGKGKLPPMHIPASPLDTNVDVPLDDSW